MGRRFRHTGAGVQLCAAREPNADSVNESVFWALKKDQDAHQ